MSRVADKNVMIVPVKGMSVEYMRLSALFVRHRRALKVVLNVRMPRCTTKQARIFVATLMGQGFAGGLLCYVSSEGNNHSASIRALYPIPQNRCRGHEDLFRASLTGRANGTAFAHAPSITLNATEMRG